MTDIRLGQNKLGDSGVKLVFAALRNPECKIQKLWLWDVSLTYSGAEDLASALSTNPSLTELGLGYNKLGDSGVKLVSVALTNPKCGIEKLGLLSLCVLHPHLQTEGYRSHRFWCRGSCLRSQYQPITDRAGAGIQLAHGPICPRSPPSHTGPPESEADRLYSSICFSLWRNQFSQTGGKELRSLQEPRPGLTVDL
ncbi:NACHT, LRR and PYD domains-containing protein 14-like [Hemitrygon akajei]|uniref:NACHT, LRR and PYD domains-containing protein 14-like n=1 Tax=Hemitrygon akajei TaxID=2704970 RepID=UPI003BF981E2